ncbi:MAG: D-alanine--D-alanine ligase [Rhodothermaceae bacterium]|nr:D-alanine--D-alanine ligase [Rhodothermaceae bacterium]MXW31930.1 D-alanine--D-alanine ligase [Rhodothermaceae bacterium]MXZ16723.1 D-alanine--D-alanine ligase [Rhodothermaceae bacterium]MYC03023.1 D-alanine--D-alanine ligase [Rhodothermaceae bacterium]MYE62071.1 D-alanine--D-alanine ligase [Rhodothermaceae bacterium]
MPHLVLVYGGQSAEHEVSLVSARNVFHAIDRTRYVVTLVRVDRDGTWVRVATVSGTPSSQIDFQAPGESVFLKPDGGLAPIESPQDAVHVDVVFPVLHGTNGEDGAIQGLFQMYKVPYVGAGVLGSSVCMDKDVSKRLLREAGIAVPDFRVLHNGETNLPSYDYLARVLGKILFVKPANTGSSIGISRVESLMEYQSAIEEAFKYDEKVLVEEAITGREIECAVLGRNPIHVSVCGEITTTHSFYSYQAKYEDESATEIIIPASIPEVVMTRIQDLARRTCRVLDCFGMARVDFFLEKDNRVLVNEVNTIPGFTSVSMYPMLWNYSGMSFSDLVDALIQDAFVTHHRRSQLIRSR